MISQHELVIEACVETVQQAICAEQNGANRIELCGHLDLDGLTPKTSLVKEVLEKVQIPVRIMIRHRAGDFTYDDDELDLMAHQIQAIQKLPIDGFVFGAVRDGQVDRKAMERLMSHVDGLHITFHKAIDTTTNLLSSVEQIIHLGMTSILTSGGCATALEGADCIREMISVAGDRIEVIACGKVTKENFSEVHRMIGARAYHGKRIVGVI